MKTAIFEAQITNIQKVNPLFSSCRVQVLYTGTNRNNSSISKEVVEKAIPSIFNIPIVAEFIEQNEDFGSHGGKIEISDKGVQFIQTTKPYGVVPESANVFWENITESDGTIREYLVVEGAYLWTGRYEEANKVIEEGKGQSMEIVVNAGKFNKDKVYEIDDFTFSALCILGNDVEPCFESANITAYNLDKEEFKRQFNQMIEELKFSIQNQSSSTKEDDYITSQEGGFQVSDVANEQVVEEVAEVQEEVQVQTVQEEANAEESRTQEETHVDEIDYKSEYEKLKLEFDTLQVNYQTLETEVIELRNFKQTKLSEERQTAEAELFTQFSSQLTEEEMLPIKEMASSLSLEEIEVKLYALVGKKTAKFSVKPKSKETVKINIDLNDESQINEKPYGHVIAKYAKN